jgi:hypothetical protein
MARRADGLGFYPLVVASTLRQPERLRAFGLAILAALRLVFEVFIVEEELFPGSENEIGATIYALKNLILELHGDAPFLITPEPGQETALDQWTSE